MQKKKVEFTVPWPPSINDYYGHGKNHQVFLKPRAKKYLEYTPWVIRSQCKEKFNKRVKITKTWCPPDKRRRDEDNHLKALNDVLTKSGIIKDK